ncbi:hypothetical protein [Hymenobacter ruricola]|uniref:Uncharacterized protein n=1 Tax=Hymenobacter ruricola TaxID=2791023 RepID=A0ABS0ICC4_9BACT|nr:hypothetical protein [Hymenobacter ruricola]MBF9224237.1 hypothetical protein [Hymenobacter ruricola]
MITGTVYVGVKTTDYDYGWWRRTVREYVREALDSADSPTVNTNLFRSIARL